MQIDSDVVVLTAVAIRDTTEPPPPVSADFVTDGVIDGLDFLAWQRGFGTTSGAVRADGDADNDHDVDSSDLAVWTAAFGPAVASAAPLAAVNTAPAGGAALLPSLRLSPEITDAALAIITAPRPVETTRPVRLPNAPIARPTGNLPMVGQTLPIPRRVDGFIALRTAADDGEFAGAVDAAIQSLDLALDDFDAAS
jgi:hypothetical protein